MNAPAALPCGNPFATRRIRPGAIDYLFREGSSAKALVEMLETHGWWGQIVGAHGTGKSTLLRTLRASLVDAGRTPVCFWLRQGDRRLSRCGESRPWNCKTLIIVDGFEQLSLLSRLWLKLACWRSGSGLLVTAHRSVGLPTIAQTEVSVESAVSVVRRLLPDGDTTIDSAEIERLLEANSGNLRETLFGLYDLFQKRRA